MHFTHELRQWAEERARAAGFDLAGVAAVPEPESAKRQSRGAVCCMGGGRARR